MSPSRRIETFNTHRMTDEAIRAVATGRDVEMAEILPVIRLAAAAPERPMPALILYGERGSGKSFLMRMVEMECAAIEGVACALLPEEQYNIRGSAQIPAIIASKLRSGGWQDSGWQFDTRDPQAAWEEAVAEMHAALDERFGPGKGIVVVLLENLDILTEKLFGPRPPKSRGGRGQSVDRRRGEERLRKLMNSPGGRFLLVASATGTVDMEYDRPLFQAFKPVDIQIWTPDTAIEYFDRRRALAGAPPLDPGERARARAIVEFIGGNPRLAHLLSEVLSCPSAHTIADTLDQLADQLADYYRQRLDSLPPAAAGVLDALIRGGEPESQTGLAARMKTVQSQIANAFSFLTRSRIVDGEGERGGAGQLYRVRDRLFVHFYRRRYGTSSGLAPIAELLERFFTPQERASQIRTHLERGEFDDARAFGSLPLDGGNADPGYCRFRDSGLVAGDPRLEFELAGAVKNEIEGLQVELRDHPERAFQRWSERAGRETGPVRKTAARVLQAVAASRQNLDQLAEAILSDSAAETRGAVPPDASILAIGGLARFYQCRASNANRAREVIAGVDRLAEAAETTHARAQGMYLSSRLAYFDGRAKDARLWELRGLELQVPEFECGLLEGLAYSKMRLQEDDALAVLDRLVAASLRRRDRWWHTRALVLRAWYLRCRKERCADAMNDARMAAKQATDGKYLSLYADAKRELAMLQAEFGDLDAAVATTRELEFQAAAMGHVDGQRKGLLIRATLLANAGRHQEAIEAARMAIGSSLEGWKVGAEEHYLIASSLSALRQTDEALGAALEAVEAGARRWSAMAAGLRCRLLAEMDSTTADTAKAAVSEYLDLTLRDGDFSEIAKAMRALVLVAAKFPWPQWSRQFERALQVGCTPDQADLEGILSAVTRNSDWEIAARVAERMRDTTPLRIAAAGHTWGLMASSDGRANTYASIAYALPEVEKIVAMWRGDTESTRFAEALSEIVDGLVSSCHDAGLLRDVSGLIGERYPHGAAELSERLANFAAFHEAPDKESHLQHIDPDLATAIRRIWNMPDPSSTPPKRRRRKK